MIKARFRKKLHSAKGQMRLDVEFEIGDREFVSFYGDSGAGKTTVLRILSGLLAPDEGYLEVDGRVWFDSRRKIDLAPQNRRVGFVFQDHNLFPHMTVRRNVEFALKNAGEGYFVDELLDMVGMRGLEHQKPAALSGGQRQRVALARALAGKPRLLLLDEPFSSLDAGMRLGLQDEIVLIYRKFGITTVFVSHDLSEVFRLSRRIFLLEEGKIIRSGPPEKIFIESHLSGKFKFVGSVIDVGRDDFLNILSVQVGNNIVKVLATGEEAAGIAAGDKVIIASKAFNPIVMKYREGD